MKLEVICGPMYSGKTTHIINMGKKLKSIGKKVLIINHAIDDRYTNEDSLCTHNGDRYSCMKVETLENVNVNGYDVVLIDEGQFFSCLKKYALHWCETLKLHVIVAGLVTDAKRKRFGDILSLIKYADNVIFKYAYCSLCKDGTKAIFSQNKQNNTEQISVGGAEKYTAVCRECYVRGASVTY